MVSDLLRAALQPILGAVTVEDLARLSGGASRETWSFRAGGEDYVLRRDPPGRPGGPGAMHREADCMRACRKAGLRVPDVVIDGDGSLLGTDGLVMCRVRGETLARRILRDDTYAHARSVLVTQIGEFLAGLHAIPLADVPGAQEVDGLNVYTDALASSPDRSLIFDKAFEWLERHRPPRSAAVLVHGDLRMGNLIVDTDGLAAVIDWEQAHLGDRVEDLAWFCIKAWRFGSPLAAGGVGTIEQLVAAYEAASGTSVDREAFHWWLVQKTVAWGLLCMSQAWAHLSGDVRSHELAAVGRRVAEQEWDVIELLAPDEWRYAKSLPLVDPLPDAPNLHGRPTAREILAAVAGYLTEDVMPNTLGQLSFHARVAANMLSIVERELAQSPPPSRGGSDWGSLALLVRDKLTVANPKHIV